METCEMCGIWEPFFDRREGLCRILRHRLDFGVSDDGCVEDVYTPHDFGCVLYEEKKP